METGFNPSANFIHAAVTESEDIRIDCCEDGHGNLEVKMLIPKDLLNDPKVVQCFVNSFGKNSASESTGKVVTGRGVSH